MHLQGDITYVRHCSLLGMCDDVGRLYAKVPETQDTHEVVFSKNASMHSCFYPSFGASGSVSALVFCVSVLKHLLHIHM